MAVELPELPIMPARVELPDWWQPYTDAFAQRALRAIAGLRVNLTSYGRGRAHNASVGGDPRSQHLLWIAADFDGADMQALLERAPYFGLVAIDERARSGHRPHIHLQLFRAGVLPQGVYDAVTVA